MVTREVEATSWSPPAVGAPQRWRPLLPAAITVVTFAVLFASPFATLLRDWWTDPDAGHGLLLGPVAVYLAWKKGVGDAQPQRGLGAALLILAVLLRYLAGLAAELFTMRASMLLALAALTIYVYGARQIMRWWLPFILIGLSIPLPSVVLGSLALPLQFKAAQLGATLLTWRHVPVQLAGNVLQLPGRSLFVTEACSGLRSLTALLSIGVLLAGMWLNSPWLRVLLVLIAIPVAVLLNGVRVFLTGFLVQFVSPAFAEGFLHYSEGWAMFVVALVLVGAVAAALRALENWRHWRSA